MTTLQARSWVQVAQRAAGPLDSGHFRAIARTALGIAFTVALLVAALTIRVLVYVPL